MLKTTIIIFLAVTTVSFSQFKDNSSLKLNITSSKYQGLFSGNKNLNKSSAWSHFTDSTGPIKDSKLSTVRTKKSGGLAMIYSLIIPGMGQIYTKRADVGKYFLISEAALWLGFASFTVYGNWLLNDAYDYSVTHAGVTKGDKAKDDNFWINIANYDNVEQYNNDMLEKGQYDKVYYPGTGFDFTWDNIADRKAYRDDKLSGDRIHNDRLFFVGAILLNHLVSAISAIVLTNRYNAGDKESGGVMMKADVIKNFNHVDGIKLSFTKMF